MKGDGHGDDLGPLLLNHFCVVMEGSFMQKMCIPKKFAETIGRTATETIELEGPSGNTWHVKMTKSNGTFVLQSGWKRFVIANKVAKNDTLIFTYKNNSYFKVRVFNPNGCEKIAPFFAKSIKLEESNDNSVGVFSVVPNNIEVKKEVFLLSSGSDTESCNEVSSRSARRVPNNIEVKKEVLPLSSGSDTESFSEVPPSRSGERICCKRKRRVLVQESSESDEANRPIRKTAKNNKDPKKNFRPYIIPQHTNLTKAQEEVADRLSRQTQKGSELFIKILTYFNCEAHRKCVLNLPSGFACNVLGSKKQAITLIPSNLDQSKKYTASYYKIGKIRYIGWRKFVRLNGLKEGVLCLFELRKEVKRGRLGLIMVVHFETKRKVKKECISRALKRKRSDSPEESTDHSDEGAHKTTTKRNNNHSSKKKTSRPSYIVPMKSYLTKAQEEIANRMTQNTQKGSELFVRTLSESNVHVALNLPCGFGNEVLGDKKREINLVMAGSEKGSRGYIGNYSKNKHGKQIGYGWLRFVHRNGLKKGDLCLFELRKEMKQGKLDLIIVVHSDC